jgi:hypothetical protein
MKKRKTTPTENAVTFALRTVARYVMAADMDRNVPGMSGFLKCYLSRQTRKAGAVIQKFAAAAETERRSLVRGLKKDMRKDPAPKLPSES